MKIIFTGTLLFLLISPAMIAQKEFSFELGAAANGFEYGLQKSSVGIRIEKHFQNDFSLNYHLSFGTMDVGRTRPAYSVHMPAGTLLGCALAASVFSLSAANSGTLELVPYCFLIPEGLSYYPVRNEKLDFGICAELLGVNYCSEKSQFATSRFSYQQNFSAVCKFRLGQKRYLAARLGYQVDFYLKNTLKGVSAGIYYGFND